MVLELLLSTSGHLLLSFKVTIIIVNRNLFLDKPPTKEASTNPNSADGSTNQVNDKTFIFVGDKMCGKSSLISKLLDEPLKDDMKETTALDYKYGTTLKENKKQKINIYELGKNLTRSCKCRGRSHSV